ncbi:hypothetical protein FQZ97_640910 [compost metagenome]
MRQRPLQQHGAGPRRHAGANQPGVHRAAADEGGRPQVLAQAVRIAAVHAGVAVALARPGQGQLQHLEIVGSPELDGLRPPIAARRRVRQPELIPGGDRQQGAVLVLQARADRAVVRGGAEAVPAVGIEGVADARLEAPPDRREVVHEVIELVIVGCLERGAHAHFLPGGDLQGVAVDLPHRVLAAQPPFAVVVMAKADPGRVVEQAVVVRRFARRRIEAAFQLEAGAPAAPHVFRSCQPPQGVGEPAVEQAGMAALPRRICHGHAGIHHAVQLHARGAVGGRRRGKRHACRRQRAQKNNLHEYLLIRRRACCPPPGATAYCQP